MFQKLLAAAVISGSVLAGVAGLAGTAEATSKSKPPKPTPTQSIVEIAAANGSFKTLLKAVGCADPAIGAALTSGEKYTVFAPTDDAFAKANLTPANVCTAVPTAALSNILLYHVTEGSRFSNSVVPKSWRKQRKIEMLNDQKIRVNREGVITTTSGNKAQIVLADIAATNGVIHVIDNVLIPAAPQH
jgi:uncharacterized surface protein with fasciclin (FAS1) repeats